MVIEELTFRVLVAQRERFLLHDARIWTETLAAQPGFRGKEVWAEAGDPEMLHLIIRWESRADWHAVPKDVLAEADRRFAAALGWECPVLACTDHDVL